jgi:hypothetical protein
MVLACLALAPLARADGDPASDYLLTQPVFVPPDVVVPQAAAKQLTATVAAAKAKGFEVRVAVIGTRYDMGSVGALFRKPQQYALFLGQELRFVYKGRLLVAMPNGYGASQGGRAWPTAAAAVSALAAPGTTGPELAAGAESAVRHAAAAHGVHLAAASGGGSGGGSGVTIALVAGVLAAAAVAGALLFRRARRRAELQT